METLRRLVKNGHSTQVTLERRFLEYLRWRPGDYVVVELTDRNTLEIRQAMARDLRPTYPQAPGQTLPLEVK